MKLIQPKIEQLLPTVPSIVNDSETYREIRGLVRSYQSGLSIQPIEVIRHPNGEGFLVSEGHKRSFAAYVSGVRPYAFLVETQRDRYEGFSGNGHLKDYIDGLLEDLEHARRLGFHRIADFEREFYRFERVFVLEH
jgi:hypothetical protein